LIGPHLSVNYIACFFYRGPKMTWLPPLPRIRHLSYAGPFVRRSLSRPQRLMPLLLVLFGKERAAPRCILSVDCCSRILVSSSRAIYSGGLPPPQVRGLGSEGAMDSVKFLVFGGILVALMRAMLSDDFYVERTCTLGALLRLPEDKSHYSPKAMVREPGCTPRGP